MRTENQVRRTARAFTLIEIIAVMVIIAMMVSAAALGIPKILEQSRHRAALAEMSTLCDAIELFKMDAGSYPTDDEGLQALLAAPPNATKWGGPYLHSPALPADPWGMAYLYRTRVGPDGNTEFLIYTYGPNKKPGGTGNAAEFGSNGVTDPEGWLSGGSGLSGDKP